MSANIAAITGLFPPFSSPSAPSGSQGGTLSGPFPYDRFKFHLPQALGHELVGAVEYMRLHPDWRDAFGGDLSDYGGDHSRADLAVCGELARHGLGPAVIDMVLRASGLYRPKWERGDYRTGTIGKALATAGVKSVPTPTPTQTPTGVLDPQNGMIAISTVAPQPRDYTVDGLLVPGKSVVLAGFGGTSKTQLAIHLSVSIALGTPFCGKTVKQGHVMMCLDEEDRDEVTRRVSAIARHQALSPNQILLIEQNMLAFPLVGQDTRLSIKDGKALTEGKFGDEIIAAVNAIGDVRLLVLDHLGLFHGGDFNAREDAALTMRLVNHIAQETGASVLLLAHTPKSAILQERSDASMVAGSTAFVDQARGAWVLATMRKDEDKTVGISDADRTAYASLAIVKNNYGPTGEVIWFKRVPFDGVGLLEQVVLNPQATITKAAANIEMRIEVFVSSHPGRYSRTKLRDTQSGKTSGPLKASKAEVDRTIDVLLADGRLINRTPSAQERAAHGLGPRVTHVLDVGLSMNAERPRASDISAALRLMKPAGRQDPRRPTRNPCVLGGFSRPGAAARSIGLAGDTEPLFSGGFSRPHLSTVLQTARRFGGSAVGRTGCVNHNRKYAGRPQRRARLGFQENFRQEISPQSATPPGVRLEARRPELSAWTPPGLWDRNATVTDPWPRPRRLHFFLGRAMLRIAAGGSPIGLPPEGRT